MSTEPTSTHSPSDIAVIGMACRFADAPNYQQFRANLAAGRESIPRPSRQSLLDAGVPAELLNHPDYVLAGGPLQGAADFDAAFFGISPREAQITDPQQRLFLECAWQALEDAGQIARVAGQAVGIYAGVGTSLYLLGHLQHAQALLASVGGLGVTLGNKADFLTLRVSHLLDLRGPSMNVQTGCSTGLVAVHCAVQSLLAGECTLALAGASSLTQLEAGGYLFHSGSIESRDGHCRAFDAQASGTTRGNGAGVVVLKRLADALADGDPIHAVIKATAVNNDGVDKISMTAPSEMGQAQVIGQALALAGVHASQVRYLEAHGTGTALGDPIEVAAISRAFRQHTQQTGFCAIGSVKSNIGHLDTGAGIAGFIKAVLSVKHREIYPTLHFQAPNPEINFAASPVYVAQRFEQLDAPMVAGVSSFGMGGTNAHAVLASPPVTQRSAASPSPALLVLSAHNEAALSQMALELADHLATALQIPDLESNQPSAQGFIAQAATKNIASVSLLNIARTLQTGRRHWPCRRFVVAQTPAQAIDALRQNPGSSATGIHHEVLTAIGLRWCQGEAVDWNTLPGAAQARHVHLPTYPFQRQRHWVDKPAAGLPSPSWAAFQASSPGVHVVRGDSALALQVVRALAQLGAQQIAWVGGQQPSADARRYWEQLDAQAGPWSQAQRSPQLQQALAELARAHTCELLASAGLLLQAGQRLAVNDITRALRVIPAFECMLQALLAGLNDGTTCRLDAGHLQVLRDPPRLAACQLQVLTLAPDHAPLVALLGHCASHHAAVLAGQLPGTAVVASDIGSQLFQQAAPVLSRHSSRAHCVRMTCQWVSDWAKALAHASRPPLRILEVGGGTGALTQPLMAALQGLPFSYCFTDLGTSFLHGARTQAQQLGLTDFDVRRLDLRSDPLTQGFDAASFDLVLGLDVVHVTPQLGHSLAHIKTLLRPGGALCLLESTLTQPWTHAIWGLEPGWWDVDDPYRPGATGPLASVAQWQHALQAVGLHTITLRSGPDAAQADTAWLLASHGPADDMLALLASQARRQTDDGQAVVTQCRAHGTQVTLHPTDALAQMLPTCVGVVDLGETAVPHVLPAGSYQLLIAPATDTALATQHAAQAHHAPGTIAWSGVTDIQPQALQRVLAAGLPQVVGHANQAPQPTLQAAPREPDTPDADAFTIVQAVWQELLGVEQPKPDDNWYALGGDSLLTTRVISLLEQRCQVSLSLNEFFNASTLAEMVAALETAQHQATAQLLSDIEALTEAELEAALADVLAQ